MGLGPQEGSIFLMAVRQSQLDPMVSHPSTEQFKTILSVATRSGCEYHPAQGSWSNVDKVREDWSEDWCRWLE